MEGFLNLIAVYFGDGKTPLHKPYPDSLNRWGFLHFRYQRNVWWAWYFFNPSFPRGLSNRTPSKCGGFVGRLVKDDGFERAKRGWWAYLDVLWWMLGSMVRINGLFHLLMGYIGVITHWSSPFTSTFWDVQVDLDATTLVQKVYLKLKTVRFWKLPGF